MQNKKWFNNTIEEVLCYECPEGYISGRLKKEKKIDKLIKRISKEDLFQYYMIENHTYPECQKHFNLAGGDINKLCDYYDIHKTRKPSKRIKTKGKSGILKKQSETAKKNRTAKLCRSISEQMAYDELSKLYNVSYEVQTEEYPYMVDFYIKDLDLYIELQAHPSHGKRPYSKDDEKSLQESYKMYGDWLNTYTIRDVAKVKRAEELNLNYIRIYPFSSLEENIIFNHNKFIDIITIVYNSQHK